MEREGSLQGAYTSSYLCSQGYNCKAVQITQLHQPIEMLARSYLTQTIRQAPVKSLTGARFYSAHSNEHHDDGHHDEDHGHHEMPLAESESILNSKTGIAAGIVALIVGYSTLNSSYSKSHDGSSLSSVFTTPALVSDLQENYSAYRARVAKQQEVQQMMMFPGERRTVDNLITRIDSVPGQYWPSGSNTQLNVIHDHSALAPRKTKESPFY